MSYIAMAYMVLTAALPQASAGAPVQRYALVIGANEGVATEPPLHYATTDAEQVASVLEQYGGFAHDSVMLLRNPKADQVRAAFRDLRGLGDIADRRNTLLFIYYSGHADALSLHLDGTVLPWTELLRLANESDVSTRLVVVDACRAGQLTQVKGAALDAPFAVPVRGPSMPRGIAIVTSATAGENAQESAALHGSFFTYHFLAALRGAGDTNGDGQITLSEAYDYSAAQTISDTASTLAGVQHATYRYHLSGRQELGLTTPGRNGGLVSLKISASGTYYLHRGSREGPVALELTLGAGNGRTVWLPTGQYYVQRRTPGGVYGGALRVTGDGALDDSRLRPVAYDVVALKGDSAPAAAPAPAPEVTATADTTAAEVHETSIETGVMASSGTGVLKDFHAAIGATFDLGIVHDGWALDGQLRYLSARAENSALGINESDISAALGARWRVADAGPLHVWLGPRLGALMINQTYTGQAAAPASTAWAPFAEGFVRLDVSLPVGFYLTAEGSARVMPLRVAGASDQAQTIFAWQPLGSLGVGHAW